tara:strand:- start:656 stop:1198 length:543 start_codon:yes stop_codon:yes gene_type:complete
MNREYIEVYKKNGKPSGKKLLKSEIHKKGLIHSTIHLWIFCNRNKILIQKRSQNKKINPGIWDVSVAGHIKYGEDIVDSVIRESKEETGIDIKKNKLKKIGVFFNEEIHNNLIDREFHHTFLYKTSPNSINLNFRNSEVEKIKFISYDKMKTLIKNSDTYFIGTNKKYYNCVLKEIDNFI